MGAERSLPRTTIGSYGQQSPKATTDEFEGLATRQKRLHQLTVAKEGAQHDAGEERRLLVGVAVHQLAEEAGVKPDVLHDLGGHLFGQVRPEEGTADVHHILPSPIGAEMDSDLRHVYSLSFI